MYSSTDLGEGVRLVALVASHRSFGPQPYQVHDTLVHNARVVYDLVSIAPLLLLLLRARQRPRLEGVMPKSETRMTDWKCGALSN